MRKEDIKVMEKQLDGLREIANKEEGILKERLEDFFSRLTGYDFRLGVQVKMFGNIFEFYCHFEFMSLKEPNATDFGSDFTIRYEPLSCLTKDASNYVLKVSNGTIGEYYFEKYPLNVERAILMGRMWQKRTDLENIFKDFINEFKTDYGNYDRFRVIVDREKYKFKEEQEKELFNETQKMIEGEGFKIVGKLYNGYEVTLTIEKNARTNYHLKADCKYKGDEENRRWYRDYVKHGTYNKEAFINSYIYCITKNINSECLEEQNRQFVYKIESKLKRA